MRKKFQEKRMSKIKERTIISPKCCECCGDIICFEKMYKVTRWGANKSSHAYYYCKSCMPSKEEVLNEIDTDENHFGIFGIDPFWGFKKKDYTRMDNVIDDFIINFED